MRILLSLLFFISWNAVGLPYYKITVHGQVSYMLGTQHLPFMAEVIPREIFGHLAQSRVAFFEVDEQSFRAYKADLPAKAAEGRAEGRNNKKIFELQEWLRLKRVLEAAGSAVDLFPTLPLDLAFSQAHTAFEITDGDLIVAKTEGILERRPDLYEKGVAKFETMRRVLAIEDDGTSPEWADLDDALRVLAQSHRTIQVHYLDTGSRPAIVVNSKELREYVLLRLRRQRAIKASLPAEIEQYMERKLSLPPNEVSYLLWKPGLSLHDASAEPSSWFLPESAGPMRALEQRHRKWWDEIWPPLQEGGVFVAVGAGHIIGDESLPAMAKTHGAEVEFVDLNCEALLRP